MKVSDITTTDLAAHLRLDSADDALLRPMLAAARDYVRGETGLTDAEIDEHEELAIAVMVIVQDLYDNRAYTDTNSGQSGPHANLVVSSILGHHRVNLV